MVWGTGVDIVEIERVKQAVLKYGQRFLGRVFTEGEIAYCYGQKDPYPHLAVRWAAKEAAAKALGSGMRGLSWRELAVERREDGRPWLSLSGRAAALAAARGIAFFHLSLSHNRTMALALVVAEKKCGS
ncbi:MAG: holo-ACP synthase [Desulfurispora sp.]|uniref:holo-ACP synthase n=1 Tax=Desulfurispora sp. TaxID=3014275 RepID=UPI00404A6543